MTFLKVALFLTTKRKTGWVVTMDIRKGMVADAEAISSILAQSWKVAFKGSVPQKYLDELKEDFWVDFFPTGNQGRADHCPISLRSPSACGVYFLWEVTGLPSG